MIQDKILYSIFLPAFVPINIYNNELVWVALDKGTTIYILKNTKGVNTNCKEKGFLDEVKKFYKVLFKKMDNGLYLYYETPLAWEFNAFYNTLIGINIARKIIFGNEVIIKEVINEVANYLNSEGVPDLNLQLYKYKEAVALNLFNVNIKKTEIDKKMIIISIIKFLKNFKLLNKEILSKIRKEKINEKISKIVSENCDFIFCQKKDLIKILDNLINGLEPEQVLISRIYDKGIQIYSFE
ncbi:MAG: hypothetical protein ACO2OV_07215 [Thermoproteota archaeon]|jgi:hypothetical protein